MFQSPYLKIQVFYFEPTNFIVKYVKQKCNQINDEDFWFLKFGWKNLGVPSKYSSNLLVMNPFVASKAKPEQRTSTSKEVNGEISINFQKDHILQFARRPETGCGNKDRHKISP